ncbi:MAG: metallopeptidase TldD-related protein [Acidobacteriota bacterium]
MNRSSDRPGRRPRGSGPARPGAGGKVTAAARESRKRPPADETDAAPFDPTDAFVDRLHEPDQVLPCIDAIMAASVADETEMVWLQRRHGNARRQPAAARTDDVAADAADADAFDGATAVHRESTRTSLLLRTVTGGRLGWYRTEPSSRNELLSGVRQSMAMATVRPPVKRRPVFPNDDSPLAIPETALFDPAIAALDEAGARALVARLVADAGDDDALAGDALDVRLHWSVLHLILGNSHGARRRVTTTEATVSLTGTRDGRPQPGAGRVVTSARHLEGLRLDAHVARLRDVHAPPAPADTIEAAADAVLDPDGGPIGPVLLAPEVVIALLDVINAQALAGRAYLEGTSFLSRHRNIQVFDRAFHVFDDATEEHGMPFPFDVEGTPKRRLELIVKGTPSTPALNQYQGGEAGLEPTAQALGGQDSMFGNLFLACGDADRDALIAAADGGIRIGWLEAVECFAPEQLHVRAIARGVRRVENGGLGTPLPDLVWEDSILRIFAQLRAIGATPTAFAASTTPFGGITAPPVVVERAEGLSRLADHRRPPAGAADDADDPD